MSMNAFDKRTEKMNNILLQKPSFIKFFLENMHCVISARSGNKCSLLRKVQIQKKLGSLKSTQTFQKESEMNLQSKLRTCILTQKHPVLKGCKHFQIGEFKRDDTNTHFNVSEVSKIWSWISSVQTLTCVFFNEFFIILERQRRTILKVVKIRLQFFLFQKFGSLSVCLELLLMTIFHNLFGTAKGHLSARAAETNLRLIPNKEITETVVERPDVTGDKEHAQLCKIAHHAELLKIWRIPSKEGQSQTAEDALYIVRRSWQNNKFHKYSEESVPGSTPGPIKDINIFDMKDARTLTWKCPARKTLRCKFW